MTKVRVKKTGEIVNVASYDKVTLAQCNSCGDPVELSYDEVEFIQETPNDGMFTSDYWEKLRHKYAGMAMSKCIDTVEAVLLRGGELQEETTAKQVAVLAVQYADALIDELENK